MGTTPQMSGVPHRRFDRPTASWTLSAQRSPQDLGRLRDDLFANLRGFLRGQRVVGRAQTQRKGERAVALGHLIALVDIEERHGLRELPGTLAHDLLDARSGNVETPLT